MLFIGVNRIFPLRIIQVKNAKGKQILGLEQFKNKNLLFLNLADVKESLEISNPYIRQVSATKIFPSTLTLTFEFESEFINLRSDKGYFILSEKGKVLRKSALKEDSLPVITFYDRIPSSLYQPGALITYSDILSALYLIRQIQDLSIAVNTVDIGSLHMVGLKTIDKTILFSTEKDLKLQVYEVENIVKKYHSDKMRGITIDVRFDKPIIHSD